MADDTTPATVVLVHGAFHGAWCWDRVVPLLEAQGVPVVAIDLPGHGADPVPPGDLHQHGDALRAVLEDIDGPKVVVGHSYGGAVISDGAADVDGVVHLVYLAAIVADVGETLSTVDVGGPSLGLGEAEVSEVPAAMQTTDDGFLVVDPDLAVGAFYADCEPADVEYALARLSPQNPATFGQPVRAAAWRTVPSTYVVCYEDRAVSVPFQRALASRTTNRVEMPTSHSPFFSAPQPLADLFAGIARDAGAG
ncbi:MAG: alpha/beta hydrolase [Actinobacteria bacterium]|nr:alpha/beta hydrolase [Actinomycetota bacterium]